MPKFNLPRFISPILKDAIAAAYEIYQIEGFFKPPMVSDKLNLQGTSKRKIISNHFSQLRQRGAVTRNGDDWGFTEKGVYWAENLDSIETRVHQLAGVAKKKKRKSKPPTEHPTSQAKKPLSEIKPIQTEAFKPNLSDSAATLANHLGAVLDDNQNYRDFLKTQLNQIADFLGAKVIYQEEK